MRRRVVKVGKERGFLERLMERRALALMRLGVATPEDERRWARQAGLTVAELRRRAAQDRGSR